MIKELKIDVNKATSICLRNGYKVYPVIVGKKFAIEVSLPDGNCKRYTKLVSGNEVGAAQRKTYIAYAKLIIKEKHNGSTTNS